MEEENKDAEEGAEEDAEELVEEVTTEKSIDNNPDKISFSKFGDKIKKNPWILVSAILGVVVLVLLFFVLRGGITGNVISENLNEPDWTIFKNSLDAETSAIILNFNIEEPKQTNNERVSEFESYEECKDKLIVFYYAGCGWCTKYYPILEQTQKDYPELEIYALDLGGNRDIAEKYRVTGTPSSVINCKYFASGYMDKEVLYKILNEFS